MGSRRNLSLVIACFFSLGLVITAAEGDVVEEFDSGTLNPLAWEMMAEAGASYTIANGQLTISSPAVADAALLYWNAPIGDEDITVEIKASVDANTDNGGVLTFIKSYIAPTANTVMNGEFAAMVWCGKNTPGWYINNDSWKRATATGPEFDGIWKAEIIGNEIHFSFNGAEVDVVEKVQAERYLCFGPDTYTSHYAGAMTIDWIKVSGPTVAAVQPAGKLPVMWGDLKSK
jgi:hypothetical protein